MRRVRLWRAQISTRTGRDLYLCGGRPRGKEERRRSWKKMLDPSVRTAGVRDFRIAPWRLAAQLPQSINGLHRGLYVAAALHVGLALGASGHAVVSKRDTRAATGWVGVIWLAPLLGVVLYVWLGINRIERRARSLRASRRRPAPTSLSCPAPAESLDHALTPAGAAAQRGGCGGAQRGRQTSRRRSGPLLSLSMKPQANF
jgi:hypothetical protein